MWNNPGKTITIYDIGLPALAKEAQLSAMLPRSILYGFESTGSWPYNRDIFTELDFAPASVTDRLFNPVTHAPCEESQPETPNPAAGSSQSMLSDNIEALDPLIPSTSTITTSTNSEIQIISETRTSSHGLTASASIVYVSPSEVYTFPKAKPRKVNQKKGKTLILTLTPARKEMALLKEQKENKEKIAHFKKR